MVRRIFVGGLAILLALPVSGFAQARDKACDRQARAESGYSGDRIPDLKVGPLTLSIGGSVAVGVSRSSGTPYAQPPRGAGAYAREQFEKRKEGAYQRAYAECLARK